jgi:hypothetical protein
MMRKYYKTNISLEEIIGTQTDTSSNCQTPETLPQNVTYSNFTPTIRKGLSLNTIILPLLQLKSLEPILPRGTVILLKSIDKTGWVFDEVLNSFFWLLQEDNSNMLYASSTSMLALQKGLPCGRLWQGDNIATKDFILAPWNPTDYHWTLVAIDVQRKKKFFILIHWRIAMLLRMHLFR